MAPAVLSLFNIIKAVRSAGFSHFRPLVGGSLRLRLVAAAWLKTLGGRGVSASRDARALLASLSTAAAPMPLNALQCPPMPHQCPRKWFTNALPMPPNALPMPSQCPLVQGGDPTEAHAMSRRSPRSRPIVESRKECRPTSDPSGAPFPAWSDQGANSWKGVPH